MTTPHPGGPGWLRPLGTTGVQVSAVTDEGAVPCTAPSPAS